MENYVHGKSKFEKGDFVIVDIIEGKEYGLTKANSERMRYNGFVGRIREMTTATGGWYYRITGTDSNPYFQEKMLLPAKLESQDAEARFIRGEFSYETYKKVTEHV